MISYNYEIAEFVFNIKTNHSYFHNQAKAYLSTKEASFNITINEEDIELESMLSNEVNIVNQDGYLEYLAVLRKMMKLITPKGVILFHGSLVSIDNEGYIYTAKSGTGKSTHVALLKKLYSDRVTIVNDDKPLIRVIDNTIYAYGTPWCGKERKHTNTKVVLKAICLLNRGKTNKINKISLGEAFPRLYGQTFKNEDGSFVEQTFSILNQVCSNVNLFELFCNMGDEAARVSYEAMSKKLSFEEVLDKYGTLVYTNVGDSMMPLIKQGRDVLTIEKINDFPKRKDIVLYKRDSGQYVLHRILRVRKNDYIICGDNRYTKEKGITDKHILGVLTKITRNNKVIDLKTNKKYKFYSFIWCDFYYIRALILMIKRGVYKLTHGKSR